MAQKELELTEDLINDQIQQSVTTPGELRVIRRNGTLSTYDDHKISVALKKAFLAVEGSNAADSSRIHETVAVLSESITKAFRRRHPGGGNIHIEAIQDQVELALMRESHHQIARNYVLYREERRKARGEDELNETDSSPVINVTLANGKTSKFRTSRLEKFCKDACFELDHTDPKLIIEETKRNLFDGVALKDVYNTAVLSARTLIESDPEYTYATARLLLHNIKEEGLDFLDVKADIAKDNIYEKSFKAYIDKGIELERLSPRLKEFDLEKITQAINPDADRNFTYLSLQTLYDRYFIHHNQMRFELPQAFFMRVAMGLTMDEPQNKEDYAIEIYRHFSSFNYMASTPTLFNSGTLRPQLSSCFLTTIQDDLKNIYDSVRDNALLSKFAGGIGNDWTPVRAMGSHIKGTNGKSLGVVPFMNVADATAIAVNQGGKRKGAVCGYLETWHMDIEEFLELRKNTGDDRRRTHDMNTANWVPDLFMERVFNKEEWTLFTPNQTPDLHELYGDAFRKQYLHYEKQFDAGKIQGKRISAVKLWRKILAMLFETGHPWVTFKDPCNLRSPQQHTGVIHSSNLCTEITLNTNKDEVAVCNLGSINLPKHMTNGKLDTKKLKSSIKAMIRGLDNVIDMNYYTIPQARRSNLKHRPIGMGIMGFQDVLYIQKIPYASQEAIEFADYCMEHVSYYAIEASCELAKERGSYETFPGSLWSQGILPIDSIELLAKTRGKFLDQDTSKTLDWDALREKIKTDGMRNSNVLAIAPTATISNICGVSQSIEPTYQNLYVKSNMSGEFTVINSYLVRDLKQLDLWDEVMVNDLKYYDGSINKIDRIPDNIKQLYKTAFEVEPKWLVECASRRQKWIDQAQSLNLYMAEPSGKKLDVLYRMAWLKGLKTTYYLRSMGATSAEKSTITDGALNAVSANPPPKACSLDDPDCEACQ